jgi:hypothetical protein
MAMDPAIADEGVAVGWPGALDALDALILMDQ